MHTHLLERNFITFSLDTSMTMTGIAVTQWNTETQAGKVLKVMALPGGVMVNDSALSLYMVTLLKLLEDLANEFPPDVILFETPFTHLNKATVMKLTRVHSVPILFAGLKGVPVEGFAPSEWRSFLFKSLPRTESGSYKKEESFHAVSTHIHPFKDFDLDNDKADAVGIAFSFYTFLQLGGLRTAEIKEQKKRERLAKAKAKAKADKLKAKTVKPKKKTTKQKDAS